MTFLTWITLVLMLITIIPIIVKSPILGDYPALFLEVFVILKLVGLTVGAMLLWHEVDQYNPILQSFCSGGKKVNCDSVLDSKYAKIFNGTLNLNLVAFSYFFGTLTYFLINELSLSAMSLLSFFSFLAMPALIVSVYYQVIIIKQWCKFCVILQVVLVVEIVLEFIGGFYKIGMAFETLPLFIALLLTPIMSWKLIKPLLEQKNEANLYKRRLKKIKNNPDVLEALLNRTRKITNSTEGLGISITKEIAKYNVIKVCNPYCGPSAKIHPILEKLVNDGRINLQILFTADVNEDMSKPVRHFLAIDSFNDKKMIQNALDDWYSNKYKDYDVFAEKYPVNGELEQQNWKIKVMRQWCDAENITYTPTVFINGHELPNEYNVEDLKEILT